MSDWRFKPFITASLKEGKTEKRISFSPNPSNGKMNIEHNLSRIDKIEVSDILGKTVYAQNSYSERKLDLSHLSSGQYVVRIFSAGNVFTRKIILK